MLPTVPARIVLLASLSLLLAGCGVRFHDPDPGTEFWESIDISGTFKPGGALSVTASYEQRYPVDVEIMCELRRNKVQLQELGRTVVPAVPNGNPDATPVVGTVTYPFAAPATPGVYIVECLTPLDEDNFIGDEIAVIGDPLP